MLSEQCREVIDGRGNSGMDIVRKCGGRDKIHFCHEDSQRERSL